MKTALVAISVNATLSISMFLFIGFIAIPIATIIASWLEISILSFRLGRRGILKPDTRLLSRAPRIILAAMVMGGLVWYAVSHQQWLVDTIFMRQWILLVVIAALGAGLYFAMVLAIRGASLQDLKGALATKG